MHGHNILRLNDNPNMPARRLQKRRATTSRFTATDANGDPLQTTILTTDDNGNPTLVTTDVVSTIIFGGSTTLGLSSTPAALASSLSPTSIAPMTSSTPLSSSTVASSSASATQTAIADASANAGAPSHTATLLTTILVPAIPLAALLILILFYIRRNARRMKEEARQSHVFAPPPAPSNDSSTAMSGTTVAGSGAGSTKKKWSNGSVASASRQMSQVMNASDPIAPPQPLFTSPSSRSLSQYSAGDPEDYEDWVCQNSPYLRPIGTPHGTPRGSPKQTPRSSMGAHAASSLKGSSPSSPIGRYSSSIATIKLPPNRRSSQPESAVTQPGSYSPPKATGSVPVHPSSALGLETASSTGVSTKRSSIAASFNTASEGPQAQGDLYMGMAM